MGLVNVSSIYLLNTFEAYNLAEKRKTKQSYTKLTTLAAICKPDLGQILFILPRMHLFMLWFPLLLTVLQHVSNVQVIDKKNAKIGEFGHNNH